jgi:hypothetical protein
VLTIMADPNGGLLGRLFCSLADGKTKVATTSTAKSLTSAAHRSGLSSQ